MAVDVVARFVADTSQFDKQVGTLGGSLKGLAQTAAGVFAGGAFVKGIKDSIDAASNLNESISKIGVVFGDSAKDIKKWSKTSAESMGLSQQAALEAAGTYGNLFRSLGIGTPVAAKMSKTMVGLAGDLASFNNASPEEVLQALQSGLVGEVEPLRKFGVSLNQSRIEAEALAMGLVAPVANMETITQKTTALDKANVAAAKALKDHGKQSLEYRDATEKVARAESDLAEATAGKVPDIDAAAKAQAAYSLIMKDTSLAQGDFARTAEGAANQQRILAAKWEEAKATLGSALLPAFEKLLPIVVNIVDAFSKLPPELQAFIIVGGGAASTLGPLVSGFGNLARAAGLAAGAEGGGGLAAMGAALGTAAPFIIGAGLAIGLVKGLSDAFGDQSAKMDVNIEKMEKMSSLALRNLIQKTLDAEDSLQNHTILQGVFTDTLAKSKDEAGRMIAVMDEMGISTGKYKDQVVEASDKQAIQAQKTVIQKGEAILYQAELDKLPPEKITEIKAEIAKAKQDLETIRLAAIEATMARHLSITVDQIPAAYGGPVFAPPRFAEGGIVTRPTLALIGERGPEAVVPLSGPGSGMGVSESTFNINVSVAAGMSPAAVGAEIVDQIRAYERVSGKAWRN